MGLHCVGIGRASLWYLLKRVSLLCSSSYYVFVSLDNGVVMKDYSVKYHVVMGLLSGYDFLDIATFLIKKQLFRMEWCRNFYMKYIYMKGKNKYQHVRFPLYRLTDKEVVYYDCPRCKWRQFREQVCMRCGETGERRT